ncbi:TPA: hypothetical protein ACXM52_001811 [Stenotrophomonas maltophilia]
MDDLLDLGGVAQMQGTFDGRVAARVEPVDHQWHQRMRHHLPHSWRGIQLAPAQGVHCLPHA